VNASSNRGFTLVEMMAVLALIGILIGMAVPRFSRRSPSSEWRNILEELNNLAQFARQESIAEQVVFRISFRHGKNDAPDTVSVEREFKKNPKTGMMEFAQASSLYLKAHYTFADTVRIRAIYRGKQELFREAGQAFCYVVPEGLVQDVYVQLLRKEGKQDDVATCKMLPFDGKFVLLEKLIKPGQEGE